MFLNQTDLIGQVIIMMTDNLTGYEALSYFLIILILLLLTQMFKLPLELSTALLLPITMVIVIQESTMIPILSLMALYMSFYWAKKFIAI